MAGIDLTREEAEVLHEVLEGEIRKLTIEIAHTDHAAFRQGLRAREALLDRLLRRVAASQAAA